MTIEINWDQRAKMTEASPDLVEPFKKVVEVAMKRVREGSVDKISQEQSVALKFDEGKRVYRLCDFMVEKSGIFRRRVNSMASLDGGLFIYGVQLNEKGEPIEELVTLQLPRDVALVSQESLFLQRGCQPKEIERLAAELSVSRKVDEREYKSAFTTLMEQKYNL